MIRLYAEEMYYTMITTLTICIYLAQVVLSFPEVEIAVQGHSTQFLEKEQHGRTEVNDCN